MPTTTTKSKRETKQKERETANKTSRMKQPSKKLHAETGFNKQTEAPYVPLIAEYLAYIQFALDGLKKKREDIMCVYSPKYRTRKQLKGHDTNKKSRTK